MRQESARYEKSDMRRMRNIPHPDASMTAERAEVIETLKKTLADEYSLQLKTQYCHWNVEGPLFFSLHKLFEEQYNELAEFVDRSAEMIRAYKETAPGSFDAFLDLSSVQQAPAQRLSATQMIEVMSQDHANMAIALRSRWETSEAAEEASAIVLYEDLIEFHEKAAWMIRSHRSS